MSRFRSRRTKNNTEFFNSFEYNRYYWTDFDYQVLHTHIMTRAKRGRGDHVPYNDVIIMADTETSKSPDYEEEIITPYYELLEQLLKTPVYISPADIRNIPDHKHFLKECPVTIEAGAIPIDVIWVDWSKEYPWIFPDDIYHPADMLQHISDYYNSIKPKEYKALDNHICLWTISLRAYHCNIATLYGTKPRDMIKCITKLHEIMPGQRTVIYFHNLSYDYVFLRKFMFEAWGTPAKQLATKPHYPIWIKFDNEIHFKDSLILAQRSLEKWGLDLEVEHNKAVGLWDYDKIRNQDYIYSDQELTYAEHDTLCGVECLDKFMEVIKKDITSIPYTSTGVLRNRTRDIGAANRAHDWFKRVCMDDIELYNKAHNIYHGGYTHANRYIVDFLIKGKIECFDFASSYPYVMLSEKYPSEKYTSLGGTYKVSDVLNWYKNDYSVLFTVQLTEVHLKDPKFPMPYIQQSKLIECVDPILDNGRVLDAAFISMELCELDMYLIDRYYKYEINIVSDVYIAKKGYLPRWFTDLIFSLYEDKCKLKFGDPVLYNISKGLLNSTYGMCAQKSIMPELEENYTTGDYEPKEKTPEELAAEYKKYLNKRNTILPYQISLYVTGYAVKNLFTLGECFGGSDGGSWYYSDTDSCYGEDINIDRLEAYNSHALEKLRANGYDIIEINGHTFQLGKAEADGIYSQFKTMGAKRYAVRKENGDISITVAGVPKKTGSKCLTSLDQFKPGFIFSGRRTGKKTHTFLYNDKIFEDKSGNEIGDSIDLSPCDYLLSKTISWEWYFEEVIGSFEIEIYDEGVII